MEQLLTVKEVADILRLGKTNTYKLLKRKDFPTITIGKKILVRENDLNEYIKKYVGNKINIF